MSAGEQGFSIIRHCFTIEETIAIIHELDRHRVWQYDNNEIPCFNLLRTFPFVHELAFFPALFAEVQKELGDKAFPVNAFVLDKTQTLNWGLDWHQDLKIAVQSKVDIPGYTHWTLESGIHHCIPPTAVLEKLISVRIHLDDCTSENGAMLFIKGSHRKGIIEYEEKDREIASGFVHCGEAAQGSVMLMKPLVLHKSPYSVSDKNRRVLQINYAGTELANGLCWY